MMLLGPLVAPRPSTVTAALSRPVAVTFSPSTSITTGRVTVSPTAVATLSISMTSPTATFCCLAPARTIAYTAVSFVDYCAFTSGSAARHVHLVRRRDARQRGHALAHRESILRTGHRRRKTSAGTASDPSLGPPAARATMSPTRTRVGLIVVRVVRGVRPRVRSGARLTARRAGSALARALLLDRDVLHRVGVVGVRAVHTGVTGAARGARGLARRRTGRPAGAATSGAGPGHHLRRLGGHLGRDRDRVRGDALDHDRLGSGQLRRLTGGTAGRPPGARAGDDMGTRGCGGCLGCGGRIVCGLPVGLRVALRRRRRLSGRLHRTGGGLLARNPGVRARGDLRGLRRLRCLLGCLLGLAARPAAGPPVAPALPLARAVAGTVDRLGRGRGLGSREGLLLGPLGVLAG